MRVSQKFIDKLQKDLAFWSNAPSVAEAMEGLSFAIGDDDQRFPPLDHGPEVNPVFLFYLNIFYLPTLTVPLTKVKANLTDASFLSFLE